MKTLVAVLLLVVAQSLEGCTYVPAVEATDLSTFNEGTATRTEVEVVLGKPLESRDTNEGSINVYDYDRGAIGGIETPDPGDGVGECILNPLVCILAIPVYQLGVWASTPFLYANKVDEQEGYLTVTYDQQDRLVTYSTLPNTGTITPEVAYERHVALASHTAELGSHSAIGGSTKGRASPTAKAQAIRTAKSRAPKTAALPTSPTIALWNGKWFGKEGAWSLYLLVENGSFTGRALRRGRDPYRFTGTISPEYLVTGRVKDAQSVPAGSLSGMFPNISLYQEGRVQVTFDLEKRE